MKRLITRAADRLLFALIPASAAGACTPGTGTRVWQTIGYCPCTPGHHAEIIRAEYEIDCWGDYVWTGRRRCEVVSQICP
ncbi:hypothetical protein Afil01_68140 [Actinorhabdospora filicis]|uniref:Uncharacterized protein n=1 Tax=Actinorhabdospora filicis TaxID=1785913 RepID=A0A9W6SUD5_9ACTN|nr:hypothetical protein [Actinorhabdospora filicis]GLZ82007.1 hypothetical protein Afil01_68140 [Actinorhabdospora filicis]